MAERPVTLDGVRRRWASWQGCVVRRVLGRSGFAITRDVIRVHVLLVVPVMQR